VGQIQDDSTFRYEPELDVTKLVSASNSNEALGFVHEPTPPFALTSYSTQAAQASNPLKLIEGQFNVALDITSHIAELSAVGGVSPLFSAQYDPAGRLSKIAVGEITDPALLFTELYDGFGRKRALISSAGLVGSFSFDALNRPTNTYWNGPDGSGEALSLFEKLSYGPLTGDVGSVERETGSLVFTSDPTDQLTSVAFQPAFGSGGMGEDLAHNSHLNRVWGYDLNGNRATDTLRGPGSFLSNFLTQDSKATFQADADGLGNVAAILHEPEGEGLAPWDRAFSYRADGLLTQLSKTRADQANESASVTASYEFDALGRRISKQVRHEDGKTSFFAYGYLADQSQIVLAHRSGEGHRTELYLDGQGANEHLGSIEIESHVEDRCWGWNPARDREDFTGRRLAFATDHLGSVLNSKIAGEAHLYGAFGESLGSPVVLNASNSPVQYGYAGMQFDSESGLYHTPNRAYSPNIGRWLSQDPIGFAGGETNLYKAMHNNPLIYVDPSGTIFGVDDAAGVVIGIVAVGAVVGVTSGIVNYASTGSVSSAFSAAGSGFVSGALSAGAAVLTVASGGSTLLATGAAASVDIGFSALTAPSSAGISNGSDFSNGVKSLSSPTPTSCP